MLTELPQRSEILDSPAARPNSCETLAVVQDSPSPSEYSATQGGESEKGERQNEPEPAHPRQERIEEELRLVGLQLEALAQENAWLKVNL